MVISRRSLVFFVVFVFLVQLELAAAATFVEPPYETPAPRNREGKCYRSVTETTRWCGKQVLLSLLTGDVHITKDCCQVLRRVGDPACSVNIFCASIA